MSQPSWADDYNREYGAARTDDERRAVAEKYMGPGLARHVTGGGVRDASKEKGGPDRKDGPPAD